MPNGAVCGPPISSSTRRPCRKRSTPPPGSACSIGGEFEPKGFLALVDGKAVGLVHYLYHRTCWSVTNNCYLQDLFADPSARGTGVGRALIEAVQAEAAKIGVANVYWMTHETNETARRLYDRVAKRTGFIEYDMLP